jgi:hypothetical protein
MIILILVKKNNTCQLILLSTHLGFRRTIPLNKNYANRQGCIERKIGSSLAETAIRLKKQDRKVQKCALFLELCVVTNG